MEASKEALLTQFGELLAGTNGRPIYRDGHPDRIPYYASSAAPITRQPCRCSRYTFPHRFARQCAEWAQLEADEAAENAKRDRAIERDGAPDREHDSWVPA